MIINLKKHLSITKKQWNGLVMLLILVVAVVALNFVNKTPYKDSTINHTALVRAIRLLNEPDVKHGTLFTFNPNKLSVAQWKKMGLNDRQISVIKNYEDKGGRFFSKQDVKKMYAFSLKDYERIAPYIDLPERSTYTKKTFLTVPIELNTADSATLTKVYGIGPAFARRIIKYRTLLGGFYSKQQLKEVYGLDADKYDEIKDQVKVNASHLQKITINLAEASELNRLPYLDYK
ncbi:MAG: hypothetical protein EOP55_22145, partial [Sphingobacteriales bacterium]